jgi:hypothetical protein
MLRIPHCLDNRLTDGGKVVSLMRNRIRRHDSKHEDVKISTSTQLREILYTDSENMLVRHLLLRHATSTAAQITAPVPEIMDTTSKPPNNSTLSRFYGPHAQCGRCGVEIMFDVNIWCILIFPF